MSGGVSESLSKPRHERPKVRVCRRQRRGSPFPEHAQFGVRLLQRDPRFQPADDADRVAFERAV